MPSRCIPQPLPPASGLRPLPSNPAGTDSSSFTYHIPAQKPPPGLLREYRIQSSVPWKGRPAYTNQDPATPTEQLFPLRNDLLLGTLNRDGFLLARSDFCSEVPGWGVTTGCGASRPWEVGKLMLMQSFKCAIFCNTATAFMRSS